MSAYLLDWAHLFVRLLHLTAGIAWIGASFYFIWLDNSLKPPLDPQLRDKGVSGELWAVHGGGFYNPQKYQLAPASLPQELHWFKWEAYTTWLSGMGLLVLVFYCNARAMLVDKSVADLSEASAIGISLGALLLGWIVYDLLCRSPLAKKTVLFSVVSYALIVLASYVLAHLFSGRAAFLHVGAMLGTMMAANVFFVIIPGMQRMVHAMRKGEAPNPEDGQKGKQRSVHNNYITLPVLFIMISGHFGLTYSHPQGWLVLSLLILSAVLVRHFFNLRHKGRNAWQCLIVAAAIILGVIVWLAPKESSSAVIGRSVSTAQVFAIVQTRCVTCHAAHPSFPGFVSAPLGVELDSESKLLANAQRIFRQSVILKSMPLGNLTAMTDDERISVRAWYEQTALK